MFPRPGFIVLIFVKGIDMHSEHALPPLRPEASVHIVERAGSSLDTEGCDNALR